MIVIVILLTLLVIAFLLLLIIICSGGTLYMFIFEHKEWKMWRYFEKNIDKFKYKPHEYEYLYMYTEYVWGEYIAYVWKDKYCSIHTADKCICSPFWRRKSKKFADKLIWNSITEA